MLAIATIVDCLTAWQSTNPEEPVLSCTAVGNEKSFGTLGVVNCNLDENSDANKSNDLIGWIDQCCDQNFWSAESSERKNF